MTSKTIEVSRELLEDMLNPCADFATHDRLRALLAAPEAPEAPLSPDLVHDRAYRNGLMAGFQFGINSNEKGYATAINKFNTEIHAAKADPPSPDHSGGGAEPVILPEPQEERMQWMLHEDEVIAALEAAGVPYERKPRQDGPY